ncbi:PWWP domain-containing protein 1-like isoform X2 [Vigna umbellata]|uniref:PWWP domain-containing protein 1-like isoform X2 n=1 Tax=Vigna umbellata TaxID=87088 RepID=UPI001F5ECCDB|nr:PWWP domain-containing protein 1-like isoform X2 [Vigna umbellata]
MTELHSQDNAPAVADSPRVSPDQKLGYSSTEEFRVRVSSDGDASSTIDRLTEENEGDKFPGSDSGSLLSEFDEYVAAERHVSRDLGLGFEVGDMVWGKVKSHPWWPGHVYNEAFASPSVRRLKREGHVLVAFFGDSSYGWFEPEELIPFDANFAEKSQQTSSRTFLRAVEEAVDEACRRRGLGLSCRCRNANNFRPINAEGYFCVDVEDYEPGGLYSEGQIRKARDRFKPSETLAFVKQLAISPHDGGRGSIGFINNKATLSAYRKAVFEQFDETYAQAFGVHPVRTTHSPNNKTYQPGIVRHTPRAPLSGPLVIAEALGGGNSKSVEVKEALKKDRYLLKRRDDPNNSVQSAYTEDKSNAANSYLFQKRGPAVPLTLHNLEKKEDTGFVSHNVSASTSDAKEDLMGQVQADECGLTSLSISSDAKAILDKGKDSSDKVTQSFELDNASSKSMVRSDLSGEAVVPSTADDMCQPSGLENKVVDAIHDGNAKLSRQCEDFNQTEQGPVMNAGGLNNMHQVKSENNVYGSPVEAKHHKISVVKKIKGLKRPADELNSEASAVGQEKKKKKKKTDLNFHPTLGFPERNSTFGKSVSVKSTGKAVSVGLASKEDFPAEQLKVDVNADNSMPMDTIGNSSLALPQLLGDLQALALNPFHGIERKIPGAVQLFFLRFRSLVYRKSLFVSPPTEIETPEIRLTKSPTSLRTSDSPDEYVKASPIVKPVKHVIRPAEPTKAGRKRAPSDRQEEIAAKRLKKIKDIKALASEKAVTSQKTSDARREDGIESQAPSKVVKLDSIKKGNSPAKAVEPTMLMIKFPPETTLPSIPELKARFARFGPMDPSGFRQFWNSSTCRVVFLHKADAQAAYKYSFGNQSLFGSAGVRCFLREFGDPAPEVSEAAKGKVDDGVSDIARVKDLPVVHRLATASSIQPLSQPIQLKSCLKKSTGDESGLVTGNGSSSKGNSRVKFMLGGEESSNGDQIMVGNRNKFNNASFADPGSPSVATDFNSKNVQKMTLQPPLPILPLPTQFSKPLQHNLRNSELAMAHRNSLNFINATASATASTVDISQQMIHLLTRCSDVVTNLTGLLGYVPYHPL